MVHYTTSYNDRLTLCDIGQVIQIDVLPDDVLLGIFDFYVDPSCKSKTTIEAWQTLVHVCRRWRNLVFQSPRRLNLRLYCTPRAPARDRLDVWPALPLLVSGILTILSGTDNIVAALRQSNRVCQVDLSGSQLDKVLAPMHVPFPELTALQLWSHDRDNPMVISDTFLGGSAPRLRFLFLHSISFPGLPKLLLSATHLVYLHLLYIPVSEYISPEAIVAPLSVLSSLESLMLRFECPRPDREISSLPSPKRSILPALAIFCFEGSIEYLEQLLTRIDAPQLNKTFISFSPRIDVNFDFPQLVQFINRTPTLGALDEAHVQFQDDSTSLGFRYRTRTSKSSADEFLIDISCRVSPLRLPSIKQVCNPSLHLLSTVEDLYIEHRYWGNDAIGNDLWLQLLLPFIAVKNLYLSKEFAPGIAAALQEHIGDRITEVLPSLQNIFVEELEPSEPFEKYFGQFVAARQLSNHTIAVSVWDENSSMESM